MPATNPIAVALAARFQGRAAVDALVPASAATAAPSIVPTPPPATPAEKGTS